MRTFKDILSVPQLFIFKLNHKYNLPLHLIIYNNDSVDVLPITSRCISDQVTKFPIRSRDDVFPIKSRSVPTKYVRSHDVFRTTYEMSDLIRIRIGSEGATDSSTAVGRAGEVWFLSMVDWIEYEPFGAKKKRLRL